MDIKNKFVADDFAGKLIFGLFALIIGIIAILDPGDAWMILCIILGIALLLKGIMALLPIFKGEKDNNALIMGVIYVVIGIVLIVASWVATTILMYLFGALLIIYGLLQLYEMLPALKSGLKGKGAINAIIAIVAVILGILVIINPGATADIIMIIIGICMVIVGLLNLVGAFQAKKSA